MLLNGSQMDNLLSYLRKNCAIHFIHFENYFYLKTICKLVMVKLIQWLTQNLH